MLTYPQLTAAEQANLPKLLAKPVAIPSKFHDSTHLVWRCQTADGEMVLKVCNQVKIAQSAFWLGLNHLFDADFPNNLGNIQCTHDFLSQNSALQVPDYMASAPNRFVLTRFLVGVDSEANKINDAEVTALANHIARLHQHPHTRWGNLHAPQFSANGWPERLQNTLTFLLQQNKIEKTAQIQTILALAGKIIETTFVPMMLDLRWDQLRCLEDESLALIDLDAFVIAPKNLDLVLLQYVLSPAQWLLFKRQYCQTHIWPDYTQQKPCYQLLLFLMNVLGETGLTRWMQQI
ncbi:MAG TPA: hypothetical protein PL131_01830 [Methylotenera sp.]|nr:hypothetical protein [Methylotenera sp.]HPH04586.1 hypothetical protein [Methylotenera sp.]HPN00739.1 hypothetical protein [Methylotenera sp.]